jgi:hypothetical protein
MNEYTGTGGIYSLKMKNPLSSNFERGFIKM